MPLRYNRKETIMYTRHNVDAKEARFKTKVHLSNSIQPKLQQTNVWGQKADEWLAAAEKGHGMNTKGHMFTISSAAMALWLYIVPQVLQIVHLHTYSFRSTSINLNTTLFF